MENHLVYYEILDHNYSFIKSKGSLSFLLTFPQTSKIFISSHIGCVRMYHNALKLTYFYFHQRKNCKISQLTPLLYKILETNLKK